jgi:glutathione S-transferase
LKLYWSPRSPFVRKVMVCAHELGVADRIEKEYTLVGLRQINPQMLLVNPVGRIPALVTDDGTVLYDSVVICEYLDATYGNGTLFPRDGAARPSASRRHALADALLETLVLWRDETSRPPEQQSKEIRAAFERKVSSSLKAAEQEAERLGESAPDIGDVTLGVALGYLDFRYAALGWRDRHPRLADAYARFGSRPSMQDTTPHDEQA